MDTRRGLYSYPALESRLAENTLREGRPGRHERPGDPVAEPLARGPPDPALQHPPRRGLRGPGKIPGPRRGVGSVHGPLFAADRRGVFPDAAEYHQILRQSLAILEQNPGADWKAMLGGWMWPGTTAARLDTADAPEGGADDTRQPQALTRSGPTTACIRKSGVGFARRAGASLRPVQARATHAILDGDSDVLISASTASGKTEAAFLPILTAIADREGTRPFGALRQPVEGADQRPVQPSRPALRGRWKSPIVRWHGDASQSAKARFAKEARGIALITPESIEAMFVRHPDRVQTPALRTSTSS